MIWHYVPNQANSWYMCHTCTYMYDMIYYIYIPVIKKFKKCKKVGIEKKVKKQDGMSTIIVNYSDKIIRR